MFRKNYLNNFMTFLAGFLLMSVVFAFDAAAQIDYQMVQQEIDKKGFNWQAGPNKFTEMSKEERQSFLGLKANLPRPRVINAATGAIRDASAFDIGILLEPAAVPQKLDWRNNNGNWVTPIRDQESCGSCWDFAAIGAWESRMRIASNNSALALDKSEQFVLSCGPGDCNGWYVSGEDGAADYIYRNGCPDESCFPYSSPYDTRSCSQRCSNWQETADTLNNGALISYDGVPSDAYIEAMKEALMNGPIATHFYVYTDFYSYQSGIYRYAWGSKEGGHLVVIIGWDDTTSPACWIVKNSWGTSWGENGFFRIAQKENTTLFGQFSYEIKHYAPENEYELKVENVLGDLGYGNEFPSTLYAGVEFTTKAAGELSAIITEFQYVKMNYTVYIYNGISDAGQLGNLLTSQPGSFGNTLGDKRIDLSTPIQLAANANIFVAVKYGNVPYAIPLESDKKSYNSGNSWFGGTSGASPWTKMVDLGDWKIRAIIKTRAASQVTVVSPNGGEVWDENSSHNITWTSQNISGNVKISYSTNAGSSWSVVTASTQNDGAYPWTLPAVSSDQTQCRVKIEDAANSMYSDTSDGNFTIRNIVQCALTVTSPNGGEAWDEKTPHNITWTSQNTSGRVKITYSINAGSSWSTITSSGTDDGIHTWMVPSVNVDKTQCLVKVEDANNSACFDVSDNYFTIKNIPCAITVTSPNGGEVWKSPSTQNITWSASNTSDNLSLQYTVDGGSTWNTIASSIAANLGTYAWNIAGGLNSNRCKVKIVDAASSACFDESNNFFTIQPGCALSVLVPNQNVLWEQNTQHLLSWLPANRNGNVKIEYTTNNGSAWNAIVNSTPDDGCLNWTVPNTSSVQCKIRVTDLANSSCFDESDNLFALGSGTRPLIQVSDIVGAPGTRVTAEIKIAGNTTAIDAFGFDLVYNPSHLKYTETLKGDLTRDWIQVSGSEIQTGTIKIGGFNTVAIATGKTGSIAKVVFDITCTGCDNCSQSHLTLQNLIDDIKDLNNYCGTFSILQCPITILVPDCEVAWMPGSIHPIKWTGSGSPGANVKIESSVNAGSTWTAVINSTPDDGCYNWTVPNTPSSQCKIRISDGANSSCFDESDGLFTIGSGNRPLIQALDIAGAPGTRVTAEIKIAGNTTAIDAFGLDLSYDPNHLKYKETLKGELTSDWIQVSGSESQVGTIKIGGFNTTAIAIGKTGSIVKIVFDITCSGCDDCSQSHLTLQNLIDDVKDLNTYCGTFSILQCPIRILVPDCEVAWKPNAIHPIKWTPGGTAGANVKIDYSLNAGSTWTAISASTPDDGCYDWQIANLNSVQAMVKVTDVANPGCFDESKVFTIGSPRTPYLLVSDLSSSSGSQVMATIMIGGSNKPFDSFGFDLVFDQRQLEFTRVLKGDLTQSWIQIDGSLTKPGTVTMGGFHTTAIPPATNGSIAKVEFKILARCQPCDASHLSLTQLVDDAIGFNPICATFSCPPPCTRGDVNMDGSITPTDALCTFEIYLNNQIPAGECVSECAVFSADANCDGFVSPNDALIIFEHYMSGQPIQCPTLTKAGLPVNVGSLTLGTVTGQPGDKVTVPIFVENPENMSAFGLELAYPMDMLQFIGISRTPVTEKWLALNGIESSNGVLTIGGYGIETIKAKVPSAIAEITFEVKNCLACERQFILTNLRDDLANAKVSEAVFSSTMTLPAPSIYALAQNYPNPFNLTTEIHYQVPEDADVRLTVYNISGQMIKVLVDSRHKTGQYKIHWNGRDEQGNEMSSGIYLYKMEAGSFVESKRMILLK